MSTTSNADQRQNYRYRQSKGQVTFYRHPHKPLLQEFWRLRGEIGEDESSHGQYVSALNLEGREFRPIQGGKYSLKARFEATEGEKIYGMGQYQQANFGSQRMRA